MSVIVVIPIKSRRAEVKAETATGTSCRLCARFSAVTTNSSMVLVDAAWVAVLPVWACAVEASAAASIALDAMRACFHCI